MSPANSRTRTVPSTLRKYDTAASLDRRFRRWAARLPNGTTVCPQCRVVNIKREAYNKIKEGGWVIPAESEREIQAEGTRKFSRKTPTVSMPGGGVCHVSPRRVFKGIMCVACDNERRKSAERVMVMRYLFAERVDATGRKIVTPPKRDPGYRSPPSPTQKTPQRLIKATPRLSPEDRIRIQSQRILCHYH